MIQEDFKDLFQQEIRNNPIVREVDQAQRRELRRSLLILIPFVAVLLCSVWQHHQLLQHGYRLEQLRQEQTRALEINRHLRLEMPVDLQCARLFLPHWRSTGISGWRSRPFGRRPGSNGSRPSSCTSSRPPRTRRS